VGPTPSAAATSRAPPAAAATPAAVRCGEPVGNKDSTFAAISVPFLLAGLCNLRDFALFFFPAVSLIMSLSSWLLGESHRKGIKIDPH
jgi:hypothetical protein